MRVQKIRLDAIRLPLELHRKTLDQEQLQRLADSIRQVGLMNPITVEEDGDTYILRAGHRRFEAHRLLRLEEIDANVRDAREIANGEVLTWTENMERANITPIEEAEAIDRMIHKGGMSKAHIASLLRRSEDWVDTRLDLLAAPLELRDLVHKAELPMRHAIELARVTDDEHRRHLTNYAIASGASFYVIRDWVSQWRLHADAGHGLTAPLPPIPTNGQPVLVTMPCHTCGEAKPAIELRILRVCAECTQIIEQSTEDWRTPTDTQPAANGRSAA